jgi:hypothetical protein
MEILISVLVDFTLTSQHHAPSALLLASSTGSFKSQEFHHLSEVIEPPKRFLLIRGIRCNKPWQPKGSLFHGPFCVRREQPPGFVCNALPITFSRDQYSCGRISNSHAAPLPVLSLLQERARVLVEKHRMYEWPSSVPKTRRTEQLMRPITCEDTKELSHTVLVGPTAEVCQTNAIFSPLGKECADLSC